MSNAGTYTTFLSVAAADKLAQRLQDRDEDGWEYFVDANETTGRAIVRVYDENGHHLGNL